VRCGRRIVMNKGGFCVELADLRIGTASRFGDVQEEEEDRRGSVMSKREV